MNAKQFLRAVNGFSFERAEIVAALNACRVAALASKALNSGRIAAPTAEAPALALKGQRKSQSAVDVGAKVKLRLGKGWAAGVVEGTVKKGQNKGRALVRCGDDVHVADLSRRGHERGGWAYADA